MENLVTGVEQFSKLQVRTAFHISMLKAVSELDVIITVLEIALFLKYNHEQCQ